ncbi:hypothetical protein DVH24_041207 [Malus domestica]|uniref:Autophagy-related protein n=1 Tax=Malus domestica TaxID=3750 RepID=A0A498IA64_MALDO|nr:hypothetical protein DVH24_041207 [Malus domestica]
MGKIQSFKQEFSFDERVEESKHIISKYPDRVPVILERYSRTDLPEMEKKKRITSNPCFLVSSRFLVPRDMSVGQFIHILSSRLHLTPGKALFVFVKNTLPQTASRMDSIYETYKEDDGFLYMCYSSEKTFG